MLRLSGYSHGLFPSPAIPRGLFTASDVLGSPLAPYTNQLLFSIVYEMNADMSCRMLDAHRVLFEASRALLSAGIRIAMSSAMIPITTSNSTSVNAPARRRNRRGVLPDMRDDS